jgi:hypothetical protein
LLMLKQLRHPWGPWYLPSGINSFLHFYKPTSIFFHEHKRYIQLWTQLHIHLWSQQVTGYLKM